jgi:ribosomal protein S12 methylthiotransferase
MKSQTPVPESQHPQSIGFVSLGCPKALTDSELILTQLSAEGYQTSKTFEGADLVIVNTCGFIDDAVRKAWTPSARPWPRTAGSSSPAAWAPSRRQAGGNLVRQMHPRCWR